MSNAPLFFECLESRRRELGLSQSVLADRCGVSLPTVHRILSGRGTAASIENVLAITHALGMELQAIPTVQTRRLLERQAFRKAERIVGMVQATSALESQGLSRHRIGRMIRKTVEELLVGSRRRLWAE